MRPTSSRDGLSRGEWVRSETAAPTSRNLPNPLPCGAFSGFKERGFNYSPQSSVVQEEALWASIFDEAWRMTPDVCVSVLLIKLMWGEGEGGGQRLIWGISGQTSSASKSNMIK